MNRIVELLTEVAHELQYRICLCLDGGGELIPWRKMSEREKKFAVDGVVYTATDGLSIEERHEKWVKCQGALGWKVGKVYDKAVKEDPFLVAWDKLPVECRVRYEIFDVLLEIVKRELKKD